MNNTSKVRVYVKPKGEVAPSIGGVIRTSAKGEVIIPKKKKEEKEIEVDELKEIVSKVVGADEKREGGMTGETTEVEVGIRIDGAQTAQDTLTIQEMPANAEIGAEDEKNAPDLQKSVSNEEEAKEKAVHATMSLGEGVHEMHQLQTDFGAVLAEFDTNVKLEQPKAEPQVRIEPDPYLGRNEPSLVLEAALFMAGQGLDNSSLGKVIGVASVSQVQKMMEGLCSKYSKTESAIEIVQDVDKKWHMRVRGNYAPAVRQFAGEAEISKHALRTLAYISKNNGVTKRNLFKRLGGTIYEDIAELEKKGFVETVPLGRTKKVLLTSKFKQYFGI